MRHWVITVMLAAFALRGTDYLLSQQPSIFRQVSFPPFKPITLGEPVPDRAPPTVALSAHRAVLSQSFGGADSIFVEYDAERRVCVIEFLYDATRIAREAVDDYQGLLGPSRQHVVADSVGGRLERWLWQDQITLFEFSLLTTPNRRTRTWSTLRDRLEVQGGGHLQYCEVRAGTGLDASRR